MSLFGKVGIDGVVGVKAGGFELFPSDCGTAAPQVAVLSDGGLGEETAVALERVQYVVRFSDDAACPDDEPLPEVGFEVAQTDAFE